MSGAVQPVPPSGVPGGLQLRMPPQLSLTKPHVAFASTHVRLMHSALAPPSLEPNPHLLGPRPPQKPAEQVPQSIVLSQPSP